MFCFSFNWFSSFFSFSFLFLFPHHGTFFPLHCWVSDSSIQEFKFLSFNRFPRQCPPKSFLFFLQDSTFDGRSRRLQKWRTVPVKVSSFPHHRFQCIGLKPWRHWKFLSIFHIRGRKRLSYFRHPSSSFGGVFYL